MSADQRNVRDHEPLIELGRGGMGVVWLARALGPGGFERLVVVKRMHPHLMVQAQATRRFLDEARVAANVHHANVVGIHQVGADETGYYLVLDYVEGDSLEGLIDRSLLKRRPLPPPVVLRIMLDALAGLHAVHEATDATGRALGILHRDVSIQNILVGRDGVARLTDFGIAKSALASVSTDARYLVGKLLYAPPEYLQRRAGDRQMDVYAAGISMWIALTGTDPWPGLDEAQMVNAILNAGVPPIAQHTQVPEAIERIVQRACSREPEARFASAQEMLEAIEQLGRDTGWLASHSEVAQLVDELAGGDLARRRQALTRSAATPRVVPHARATGSKTLRPALSAIGLGLGAAAIAAAAWLLGARSPSAAQTVSATPDAPVAASVIPDSAATASGSAPASSSTSSAASPPPPAATRAQPVRTSAPQEITTSNPYR